ncbi:hypothetical protein Bca4012_023419 [Brassica carinata]
MNPLNLATTSAPPPVANDLLAKRKRGRPRKDETTTQPQQENVNLVGKTFSGVVEGSFDAGYILYVKVKDSDTMLRGIVFVPGKVTPVTPENDVAPRVKMFAREEVKNQTDLPPDDDQPIKDVEICESAGALSLVPYQSDDEEPKEAVMEEEKDGVMEEGEAAATPLLEFFPTPEATMVTPQQSLVLAQEETTEQQKPPGESQTCGFGVKEPVGPVEKVPQELRLELGNKMIMSGESNDNKSGTDPKTSVCKSGFIANLFEGEGKKVDCPMEDEAAPSSSVTFKCLLVTNDEMRDHIFELLSTSFFQKWKLWHQVRYTFVKGSLKLEMPPPFSVAIQESEKDSWHVPITCQDGEHRFDHANSQTEPLSCS